MICTVISSVPAYPVPTQPGESASYKISVSGVRRARFVIPSIATAGMVWPGPNIPAKPGSKWACISSGRNLFPLIHQTPETIQCPSS